MKKLIIIPIILLLSSCKSDQYKKPESTNDGDDVSSTKQQDNLVINWIFESKYSDDGDPTMPITDIFVEINGEKFKVIDEAQGSFTPLDKADSISWKVPETALTACIGGWGGLYRCVYVEKQDNELTIKQAWSDAESDVEEWMDIELIRTIKPNILF